MPIDNEKLDVYSAWIETTKNFESKIQKIIAGEEIDLDSLRREAANVNRLFNEYRKVWGID